MVNVIEDHFTFIEPIPNWTIDFILVSAESKVYMMPLNKEWETYLCLLKDVGVTVA